MKAVGYQQPGAIDRADALIDIEIARPAPTGRDLLVEVQAVAVNPVDTKVRRSAAPPEGEYKVLGYDAVGIVRETGPDATLFRPGDAVWYAGAIDRAGSNAEFQLVDERLVGRKPSSLSPADAAALPLTGITAWELLFDRLKVPLAGEGRPGTLLIVGAAGGVGSILIQLARQRTGLTVVGTASRPESRAWALALGAQGVAGMENPYERLKELTRGRRIGQAELVEFVRELGLPADVEERFVALTPATYVGLAPQLVRTYLD